ncbi:MAG: hypothetical protein HY774_28470 [Acidobacteria bacterium]|nr:hypothetical protein [Acidobacteriota bacterium]
MAIKSLICTLNAPAKLCLNNFELSWQQSLKLDEKITSPPTFPPWETLAEILVDPSEKIFVGISYFIPKEYWEVADELCNYLDVNAIRLNKFASPIDQAPYRDFLGNDFRDVRFLECTWCNSVGYILSSQLDDVLWYKSTVKQQPKAYAIGVNNLDFILKEYNLSLPTHFDLPKFSCEFVESSCVEKEKNSFLKIIDFFSNC